MGCDIHCYAEFRKKDRRDPNYWDCFGGHINPGRDYDLFGKLAGVRSSEPAMFPIRGIPDHLGYWAASDWFLYIDDKVGDSEGFCTSEAAARYAKHGSKIIERDGKPYKVAHPDWHTPSWVSVPEFEEAVASPSRFGRDDNYWALLAALKELVRRGNEVRLVFWFDN